MFQNTSFEFTTRERGHEHSTATQTRHTMDIATRKLKKLKNKFKKWTQRGTDMLYKIIFVIYVFGYKPEGEP